MFIETVPNRDSPPAVLLRESYRDESGRTQKRTLANLSKLPEDVVAVLKAILKGGALMSARPEELQIERSLPHGHVAAALGLIREIALDRLILSTGKDEASRRYSDLVVAMLVDLDCAAVETGLCAGRGRGDGDDEPGRDFGPRAGQGS